jgi:dipeptidyl-peptidase-4
VYPLSPWRLAVPFVCALAAPLAAAPPVTVAEKSDYKATSKHAEVVAFCEQLAEESPLVRLGELGASHEGRKLPLVILADPPVSSPAEAKKGGRLVVFAMGNIHAGEVDGKEALLALMRDLALAKERPLLKKLVLVFCPIFNADGNEKMARANRKYQSGPGEVGTRVNAQGFDLNRDFVKLESPEARALVRFLNRWDPAVVIDCHTTNGSFHRYALTYEGGRCPAGDKKLIDFTRDELLPEVTKRMQKRTGYLSAFYGNFSRDRSEWETVPPTPRFGTHYVGLRNRIAVLSESYVYAPYKDRVKATYAFVRTIMDYVAENRDKVSKLLAAARESRPDKVVLRFKAAALGRPRELLGFEDQTYDKATNKGKPKTYEVTYNGGTSATLSVTRPSAYLIPASFDKVGENLQRHGLTVEELREDVDLDVEAYRVEKVTKERDFQKHQPVTLEVASRKVNRRVPAGTLLVRTAQPLGHLACFLLEPRSIDGLATWNFFDKALKEGADFPVLRLPADVSLLTGRVRPLAEDRKRDQPITPERVQGQEPLDFAGNPTSVQRWLDDEHFVQDKGERQLRVHAATGKSEPYSRNPTLTKAILTTLKRPAPKDGSKGGAKGGRPARQVHYNPDQTAALVENQGHLYHVGIDGKAVQLTKAATGERELVTISPDGKHTAFVRGNNLYTVDVATQTERALTKDGGENVRNGKASWVYFEELFHRSWQAYWWSSDGKQIAFLRSDESAVPRFRLTDGLSADQKVETTAYPKAGQPNPLVKLGVASTADGSVRWVDLKGYAEKETLVVRAGFTPDGQTLYYYVQDRAQTWLDFCIRPRDGESKRLFRETTKAWVDDLGAPRFLKDGSFLIQSERTGWKHVYHYGIDGKLRKQITSGEWEARRIEAVDEEGGWLYVSGTRDSHVRSNLYRVKLDGTALARLTKEAGDHSVSISPKAKYFVDTRSSHATPTQVHLHRTDGAAVRVLDVNPVYQREEYRTGKFQMVQIKTPDDFVLEGSVLYPPNFDPQKKRYPVWFMTYAGPHAPQVRDSWGGGRVRDEMLAQQGFVVFRCDPRSASGKGAVSAWAAYKQLGVQELKDVECAVGWLCKQPGVDAARVGISGGSYGGFMTAYAMTHSKRFAAGVASAPVTDWRNYDSIYTERYMGTPKENPKGYEATSVVRAARDLHGKLLLVHGLMDDNVHAQNSIALVDALQRANKDFDVMFYPRSRHGIRGPHYQRLTLDFMRKALRPEG